MNIPKSTTEAVENYLKAIYYLSCDTSDHAASQQKIADHVGVSISGVSKMLRSMAKGDMIEYAPYQPVKLTDRGEKMAIEVIRHHRLLELYLVQSLGFGWDEVHREADRLEHYISEEMESRIESVLGFPSFDPHGDPIPTRDGVMPKYSSVTLASQIDGATVVVRRVADEDNALLVYLGERGIRPGADVLVVEREPFGGSLVLDVCGKSQRISLQAAAKIFIEPAVQAAESKNEP